MGTVTSLYSVIILKPPISLAILWRHVTSPAFFGLLIFVSTSVFIVHCSGVALCFFFFTFLAFTRGLVISHFLCRSIDAFSLLAAASAPGSYPPNLCLSLPNNRCRASQCTRPVPFPALYQADSAPRKPQKNHPGFPCQLQKTNVQRDLGATSSWPWSQKMETLDIRLLWVNWTFVAAGGSFILRVWIL